MKLNRIDDISVAFVLPAIIQFGDLRRLQSRNSIVGYGLLKVAVDCRQVFCTCSTVIIEL